jgi:mannose-6-phosphate isomerase-like protein (cupin superfamily)
MQAALDNVWFENARQGQKVRILSLPKPGGSPRFELEYVYRPFTGVTAVPAHFHPAATETFEILSGTARYRIGREEGTAGAGERVVMPPGLPHVHPYSVSGEELRVRQTTETEPADPDAMLASLQALVTIFGCAAAGKVSRQGLPNLLQLAVLVDSTMPGTYLARPPVPVQKLLFSLLARLGRALGYRASYPHYGVLTPEGLLPAST